MSTTKKWLLWFQILVLLFSHNQKHTELINQFRMIRCRLSCFLSPSHRGLLWSRVAVSMLMSSQYSAGERDLIDLNWTRQMDGSSGPFGKREMGGGGGCHLPSVTFWLGQPVGNGRTRPFGPASNTCKSWHEPTVTIESSGSLRPEAESGQSVLETIERQYSNVPGACNVVPNNTASEFDQLEPAWLQLHWVLTHTCNFNPTW